MRRLVVILSVVALMGCGAPATDEAPSPTSPVPSQIDSSRIAPNKPAPVRPRTPERLSLWRYDAPVVSISPVDGVLIPPDDPSVLGWWGRPAGSRVGATVLTGHTVHSGGGTFDDLEDLPSGTVGSLSSVEYIVTQVQIMPNEVLADRASRLFDQSGPHRLLLITCEDYDSETGTYASNVVVTLERVS